MTVAGLPLRTRFDMYVHPEPNTGCFLWAGALDPHGYGALTVSGVTAKAHRLAYEFACGEVPKGLSVLHRCDVPCCVNTDHLFVGTNADNTKDMWSKGRGKPGGAEGETHPEAKLTDAIVREIRQSSESTRALARLYGVHPKTLRDARSGKKWKHIQ